MPIERVGDMVQHYGYTAYGNEQYKNNTLAFSVTNRYTGQQIDEDTGLYFYQSRYYDPKLARFIQADTIVPDSSTSQALNRYTYVRNNPLKFTDPSGHGWFSKLWKKIKPWIGTIVTIALTPFVGPFAAALIGSAIGTLINGGTWKSFAIGVGIGIAAGGIGDWGGIGGWAADALGVATSGADFAARAFAGALTGAASGVLSSVIYGQNIEKGLAYGAYSGAIGGAAGWAAGQVKSYLDGNQPVMQACELGPDNDKYEIANRVDLEDLAEFASAWINEERIEFISTKEWSQILGNTRDIVKGNNKWNWFAPLGLDTNRFEGDHTWYIIESLMKFSKGYEINYIAQGMFYNYSPLYFRANIFATTYTWKGLTIFASKVPVRNNYFKRMNYTWPTKDELFYSAYGFDHFYE